MNTKLRARPALWVLAGAYMAISTGSAQPLRSTQDLPATVPVTAPALVNALENNWSDSVQRDSQGHVVTLIVGAKWCNDQNLALVAELHELRQLSLQGRRTNTISANGIRLLHQNTNLCSLSLACFFTNLPAGILTELATLPHITQLRLIGAEPAVAEYAVLATMTNLTDFQIHYGTHFGDAELARFTNAPSLKNLVVDSISLSSNSAALLPRFPVLTNAELRSWTDRTSWKTNWHSGSVPLEQRLEIK
jgi:hypothetical protein